MAASVRSLAALDPALADAIDAAFDRWPVPGLAVSVVRDDQAAVHCRGLRRMGAPGPVDASTRFDLCSVGKAFTALALARAEIDGRLSLDDAVSRHLAEWAARGDALAWDARLRDLLAHRVGLADTLPAEAGLAGCAGAATLLERLCHLGAATPLRAGFTYANTNYIAAHAVHERAAGALDERLAPLLNSLGMEQTHFDARRFHSDAERAAWHAGRGADGPLVDEPVWPGDRGAGNTYSSARDLVQWLRFLTGAIEGPDPRWRTALEACLVPAVAVNGHARRLSRCPPEAVICTYGLGWALSDLHGRRVIMHGGEMPGTRAWIAVAPDDGVGVAVLCNASRPLTWAVGHLALHHLLDLPTRDWVDQAARCEHAERERWAAHHATLAAAAAARNGHLEIPIGRWQQAVAGPVRIERQGGEIALSFADVPFWNGTVQRRDGQARLRFTDPAARDIFGGLEPPLWWQEDGRLHIADFGEFLPA